MTGLLKFFHNKKILILGFGLEGKSTLNLLKDLPCEIIIADKNPETIKDLPYKPYSGENYLDSIYDNSVDIIMKSPGIALLGKIPVHIKAKITSQTDLLMRFRKNKIIGITGTKGKSTVSSLIDHILNTCGKKSALIGNIGIPPLEKQFKKETILTTEMSCHQLEYVSSSPDIAVLLNIYEEHLDHYNSFADYKAAKENIYLYQKSGDLLFYLDELKSPKLLASKGEKIEMSYALTENNNVKTRLSGKHNQYNIAVAVAVCVRLGCDEKEAARAVESFNGLPHRLEFAGAINNAEYINDSISTIPRAAISAVLAFPDTDTLIIGGMDRGIDYSELIDFLRRVAGGNIPYSDFKFNLIVLPDSGYRIADKFSENVGADLVSARETQTIGGQTQGLPLRIYRAKDMQDAVNHAAKVTKTRCILSPAAASYGFYKNFEERGKHFKELVKSYEIHDTKSGN
ncbi:MAG: UDP-N-acetylmuramoyl-L-alanine--D-glutamate ligase [Oscillospiraceae bacterium]|nr:UDP-N-acetylmuramoyl-L-alanine--D-glutamate ligase [Oscillospiraceae bacterium]